MFNNIKKLNADERAALTIVLQSYKYLLQDDEIRAKLNLDLDPDNKYFEVFKQDAREKRKKILFDSIDQVIEEVLPKISE